MSTDIHAASHRQAVSFLKKLDRQIHRYHPPMGHSRACNEIFRDLTAEEWNEVVRIIKEYDLPCRLITSNAYGLSLVVHDRGIEGVRSPALLLVFYGQVPFARVRKKAGNQEPALRRMSRLTHCGHNKELLDFYGFQRQMPPEHYL